MKLWLEALCLICIAVPAINSTPNLSVRNSLEEIEMESIKNYKVRLQHRLEGARIRRKRQAGLLPVIYDNNQGPKTDHLKVSSSELATLPFLSQYNITSWTDIDFYGRHRLFVGTQSGELILFEFGQNQTAEIVSFASDEHVAIKVEGFVFRSEQWFAVLQSSEEKMWIQMYQDIAGQLERRQQIVLAGDSDFDLVNVRGGYYLIVVTYRQKTDSSFTYSGTAKLYHWTQTQFDLIASGKTYGARSVVSWVMDGALYFAVSQVMSSSAEYAGSPIFFYNPLPSDRLILLDRLQVKGPMKVNHFSVRGNHYLVFVGASDAEIYWWSNNQFLLWQTIANTAAAVDITILTLSADEVVIMIVLKEEVLFLTLDPTGHYAVSFRMSFAGFDLTSLQLIFDGIEQIFYALALSVGANGQVSSTWKLGLDQYDLPDITAMDPLIQCLNGLKQATDGLKNEIAMMEIDIGRVWVHNKDQAIIADVFMQGSVSSDGGSVSQVVIASNETTQVTPGYLYHTVGSLTAGREVLDLQLSDVVFMTESQEISGPINFINPVSVPSLYMPVNDQDIVINGVSVVEMDSSALREVGDQHFTGLVQMDHLSVTNVNTNAINNIELEDLVLLHGYQNISGHFQFSSMQGGSLVTNAVNSIHLASVVTTNLDQNVTEVKSFGMLRASAIAVLHQTNGEYLREFNSKMVTLDTQQAISGRLELRAPTTVLGNIVAAELMDGISLEVLDAESVKLAGNQDVFGATIFTSDISVRNNVDVKGSVNGLDLRHVITTSTEQTISGDIDFLNRVDFASINSTYVNGLDFSQDLVLSGIDQNVDEHKFFQHGLIVGNIGTAEGVKIDGVNVAHEARVVVQHEGGVVTNAGSFHNVHVIDQLTATSGVNGLLISDLPSTVWLKSQPQTIEVPVIFSNVVAFNRTLNAPLVNNLNLQTDVVSIFGSPVINAEKTFINRIHVKDNIGVAQNTFFSGLDLSSFQDQILIEPDSRGTVYGKKTITNLEVFGNVETNSINDMNLAADIMFPTAVQDIYGVKELRYAIVNDNLAAGRVDTSLFNGIHFSNFTSNAVLKDQVSMTPVANKAFSHLVSSGISMSGPNEIDGVVLLHLLLTAVTLNDQQDILADKTFVDPVHLSEPSISAKVNGLDLQDHFDRVVLTDEQTVIRGHKTFSSSVVSSHAEFKLINSVDLSALAGNYISKSEYDEIMFPWYISNSIEVGSLIVSSSGTLDGIVLDQVLRTYANENFTHPVHFFSDQTVKGNLVVHGLINECDVNKIGRYAIRTYSDSRQVFDQSVVIDQLIVKGSVNILNVVNEVNLSILNDLVIGGSALQVVGDLHIYPGIIASEIHVKGSLNNSDIDQILRDAVLKSSEQVISGYKRYRGDLEAAYLEGRAESFLSESVNDVKLDEILKTAVTIADFQIVDGEKAFKNLRAGNVSMFEFINGIRIPYDIVLSDDNEHISTPVFFMKDMEIHSSLIVHGRVDGVLLNQFVENHVTLDGNETLVSQLVFSEDAVITGELLVGGLLNGVSLPMALTITDPKPIHGSKSFTQDLTVSGSLYTPLVNGRDVNELSRSVLYSTANESLAFQQFTLPVHVKGPLLVDTVNGLSVDSLTSAFYNRSTSLNTEIEYFKELGTSQGDAVTHQKSTLASQVSQFAYFVLHQEIYLGSVRRVLHGFPRLFTGSYSVVVHVTQKQCVDTSNCCSFDHSYWVTFDKMSKVLFTSAAEPGWIFPAVPLSPTSSVLSQGLVMWTNATLSVPQCCNMENQQTIIGTLSSIGAIKPFSSTADSSVLAGVKAFKDTYTYIVAAYEYDSKHGVHGQTVVYQGHESSDTWRAHQGLQTYGALSLDLVSDSTSGEVLLALGSGIGTYPDSYSSIYRWNSTNIAFQALSNIPSQNVRSIMWFWKDTSLYLAVANLDTYLPDGLHCSGILEGGHIDIYAYSYGYFKHIQTVHLPGVVSMASFAMAGETYLAAGSLQLQAVVIYEWQGFSGFRPVQSIPARSVQHLNMFWIKNELYMSVASENGPFMLWKAVARGAVPSNGSDVQWDGNASELKDQPEYSEKPDSSC